MDIELSVWRQVVYLAEVVLFCGNTNSFVCKDIWLVCALFL